MEFSDDFLRRLAEGHIQGDVPPFSTGDAAAVEAHLRRLVARLAADPRLLVTADFGSYGSGYASYVPVRVSRRDGRDTRTTTQGRNVTEDTAGVLAYLCRLAPYWFYGGSNWSVTQRAGQPHSGSSGFLAADSRAGLDQPAWATDLGRLEERLCLAGYQLLPPALLAQPAPARINVPTVLADPPYQVFDCFFYWED